MVDHYLFSSSLLVKEKPRLTEGYKVLMRREREEKRELGGKR